MNEYIIEIKGDVKTDFYYPSLLNGLGDEDWFSNYFNDHEFLKDKGVRGGELVLKYDAYEDILYVVTEYTANEKLTPKELKILEEYTVGQWSDGIGEGFEQQPHMIEGEEVYISVWHRDQIVTARQYIAEFEF